jgi:hypothetical protein
MNDTLPPADDTHERLTAQHHDPTDVFIPFERDKHTACEEEGHLLHHDGSAESPTFCLRCPYTEPYKEPEQS